MSEMVKETTKDKEPQKKAAAGGYQTPFIERYRPRTLDDVVGNEDTVSRLRAIGETGNLPNLILSGPPGTGKTTSVHALARHLLGSHYKDGVLELNASDSRGIDVSCCKTSQSIVDVTESSEISILPTLPFSPGGAKSHQELCHEQGDTPPWTVRSSSMQQSVLTYVSPHLLISQLGLLKRLGDSHKIIILDEADSMTGAAQQALRRTMEIYSGSTRFCLACNNSTKIIEAIQSRAAILRYSRLSNEDVLECLLRVCQAENIGYTEDGLEAILFTAEGDMRHALNNLQASFHLTKNGLINQAVVFKVCDQPHPKTVGEIIECCAKGDTRGAVTQMQSLWKSGYSASDIIGTTFRVVKAHATLPEAIKLEYLREIGFTHMRIAEGVSTLLQLLGLVSRLAKMASVQ
jgi:DNA polymerase III delta prime subunit